MTFTITEITRCGGGGHLTFTVQIGAQTRTIEVEGLDKEPDDLREAFSTRVRSAVKEASANTWVEARAALINKEFKI